MAALPGVGFGILAGVAVRSYFGTTDLLEPDIVTAVVTPWGVAVLLAVTAGALATPSQFRRDASSDA